MVRTCALSYGPLRLNEQDAPVRDSVTTALLILCMLSTESSGALACDASLPIQSTAAPSSPSSPASPGPFFPDALSADVREGRVESVEGAIRKRVVRGRASNSFYLEIDRRRLQVSRSSYAAAPDAGIVRAYYLPRSRRVVNLERLPDPALPTG